ncbi:lipoyltransferase 1, mitochondrial-like [Tetranychus urticae]|nr:lipoyltransferase 1, mitochondrial-like [Tetranychus urticae]
MIRTLSTKIGYSDQVLNRSVIISTNDNIYRNLALEDWLYNKYPVVNKSKTWYRLLLWHNKPCIVLGRHQNPWNEVHINRCQTLGIPIARRNSGGGTVFHDLGNLNLCFLSDKKSYNRKRNNELIIRTLNKYYGVNCEISSRENLITKDGGFKVSGTASKLSSLSAYHHCTLMLNVDLTLMVKVTKTGCHLFENKATPSVHASVENLCSICPSINMNNFISNISSEFINEFGDNGIIEVDPDDRKFNDIDAKYDELTSWKWIFGKTPKFEITYEDFGIKCKLVVNYGLIEKVETLPCMDFSFLKGVRFVREDVIAGFICNEHEFDQDYLVAR